MDDMADPIPIQQTPQYTITLDGQTIKTNQIHYKIEAAKSVTEQQQSQTFTTPVSYQKYVYARIRYTRLNESICIFQFNTGKCR